MEKGELNELTRKAKLVMQKYQEDFPDVRIDRDYLPFKITEEWGECLQTYLMLTDRGRQKGKSKEEIKQMFADEIADVFGYLMLFAEAEGVDPRQAIEKKWFVFLKDEEDKQV